MPHRLELPDEKAHIDWADREAEKRRKERIKSQQRGASGSARRNAEGSRSKQP